MDSHILEQKVLEKVMKNIPLGLVVSKEGHQRKVYYVNREACQIMGYSREEYTKKIETGWSSFLEINMREVFRANKKAIFGGEPFEVVAHVRTKSGDIKWILHRIVVRWEGKSEPVSYVSFMDVTGKVKQEQNRQKEREALKERAARDSFTKLLNRGTMEQLIDIRLKEDTKNTGYAYLALDVDDFKQINDAYGHCVGDRLILELSRLLTEQFGKNDYIGRMGGDEFAVFVTDMKEREAITECAERILAGLREKKDEMGLMEEPSVSIGIAFYPESGKSFMELYHKADDALYKVKNNTKNGIAVFE